MLDALWCPVMRHILTLLAALVVAPLAWILIAFGQDRSTQALANASGDALHSADFVRPILFLGAAGILLGLIATLRVSPLGAAVAGVAYTASYVALLIDPRGLLDLFNRSMAVAGQTADMSGPIRTGTTLLLGAVLLVAVASVDRWRRWPHPTEAVNHPVSESDVWPSGDGSGLDAAFRGTDPDPFVRSTTGFGHSGAYRSGPYWADSLRGGDDRR